MRFPFGVAGELGSVHFGPLLLWWIITVGGILLVVLLFAAASDVIVGRFLNTIPSTRDGRSPDGAASQRLKATADAWTPSARVHGPLPQLRRGAHLPLLRRGNLHSARRPQQENQP
jgi:hypothetical protein